MSEIMNVAADLASIVAMILSIPSVVVVVVRHLRRRSAGRLSAGGREDTDKEGPH